MWLLEMIVEVFLEGVILNVFKYPGSAVIWILSGFTLSFEKLLEGSNYITGFTGLITVLLIGKVLLEW